MPPQALASPSIYRHPPSSWLSLRESWREAPERAHRTDSTDKLPSDPPHRFLIRNCILPPTVCTIPLPLPSGGTSPVGRGKGCVRTSNSTINRDLTLRLSIPTALLALPPAIDARQALGSPSGRAGAKRLRGITAPILPTSYPQIHCRTGDGSLS